MTMPAHKPGKSKQDYATPREFIAAVERRFGPLAWDLAAHEGNHATVPWFGPGSPWARDSLIQPWHGLQGNLWLNPPFADIEPWARKCDHESIFGARILFLVPASVGSEWYRKWVHDRALVLFLSPRLVFDGKSPYPKDCLLAAYGYRGYGYECWRWDR